MNDDKKSYPKWAKVVLISSLLLLMLITSTLLILNPRKLSDQAKELTTAVQHNINKSSSVSSVSPSVSASPSASTNTNGVNSSQTPVLSTETKPTQINNSPSNSASIGTQTSIPTPIMGWEALASNADKCSSSSQGDKIYCAPGNVGTYFINTTQGTTIKRYWEQNGLDTGTAAGLTVTYSLVSPSQLRVQVSSDRTRDTFGVYVNIEVNELASPQQKASLSAKMFSFKAICLANPPASGCAR